MACWDFQGDGKHLGDLGERFSAWQIKRPRKCKLGRTPSVAHSVMARDLLEAWGFDTKSGQEVQREAPMAVVDGACNPDLMKVADLWDA